VLRKNSRAEVIELLTERRKLPSVETKKQNKTKKANKQKKKKERKK